VLFVSSFFYISDLIWFRLTIDCGIQWYFIFTIDYVLFNHHIYDEKIFKKYIIQINERTTMGLWMNVQLLHIKDEMVDWVEMFFLLLQVIHDHSHQAAAPQRLLLPWLSLTRNILFS